MPQATVMQLPRGHSPNFHPPGAVLEALGRVRRPVIVGHVTPDADCLGSMYGLAVMLRLHEVDARVGLPGDVAAKLQFLIELAPAVPRVAGWDDAAGYDALIAVDTASQKRINLSAPPALDGGLTSFNFDHHITNTDFATHNWVDSHATSASELIARLLAVLEWKVPSQVASLLYAGIHGDTGGFSLPSTNSDALHVAAELVRAGADVAHLGEQLCRSQNRSDFELLRHVYDHTRLTEDGRIAYSHLSHADMVESGCTAADIDDQVSIPRALRGVRIAMLFSEGEPGEIRINLRGEGTVTVVEIAQQFGGGGHAQSAGVRMRNKPMEQVIGEVVAAAEAHLERLGIH